MAVKYKQYVQQMVDQNKEKFAAFKLVHDNFAASRKLWRQQFNETGKEIVEIMRDWEQRLCSGMERGKYASYSARLAEQFWTEIKKTYPLIELVGVESNFG